MNFVEFFYLISKAVKRSLKPLLIINILILAGGIFWRLTTDLAYSGQVVIKSNFAEFNYIESMIEPLNQHVKDGRPEGIARSLGIDLSLAQSCGRVVVSSVIEEEYVTKRKLIKEEDLGEFEKDFIFELTIHSSDKKNLPALKDAVLNYLRKQPFIQSRREFYKEGREFLLELLRKDIASMDSIKNAYSKIDFNKEGTNGSLIIQDFGDFFYGTTKVYQEYIKFSYFNRFDDSFEEVSSFEYFDKYTSPRWTNVLLITALIGIVVSTIYILIAEVRSLSES